MNANKVLNETAEIIKDHNISTDSEWDSYCKDLKVNQAFDKLTELGYYHDSGLYGWIPKRTSA